MPQKRILISRPDRIGDVVLSTPIPREIKRKYPDSFVAVMLRSYTKDIYLNNPFVDEVIIYDGRKESFWAKVKELKSYKFTHALMLLPDERINYLLFFAGIRTRVGVGHKLFQFITFTRYVDRNKYIPLRHEADYCMDLARKIGVEASSLETAIYLTSEEKAEVEKLRDANVRDDEFLIGIHSSSGNSAPNWKPSEYRELIRQLNQNRKIKIAVTDNSVPAELKDIEGVWYPNVNQELRGAIKNIAALDLLVSASTGPMHIAASLKVRTLSLFCPLTACSPELWGPLGNDANIIMPDKDYCRIKCPGDPKICTFSGEGGINPVKVSGEICRLLNLS